MLLNICIRSIKEVYESQNVEDDACNAEKVPDHVGELESSLGGREKDTYRIYDRTGHEEPERNC